MFVTHPILFLRIYYQLQLFEGGLLHAKTVNMDIRSFYLNLEVSIAIYDAAFTKSLDILQQEYLIQSKPLKLSEWGKRSHINRFTENTIRLISPLL